VLDFSPCFVRHSLRQWTYFLAMGLIYALSHASVASAQTWTNVGQPRLCPGCQSGPGDAVHAVPGVVFDLGHPVGGILRASTAAIPGLTRARVCQPNSASTAW